MPGVQRAHISKAAGERIGGGGSTLAPERGSADGGESGDEVAFLQQEAHEMLEHEQLALEYCRIDRPALRHIACTQFFD